MDKNLSEWLFTEEEREPISFVAVFCISILMSTVIFIVLHSAMHSYG